MKEILRLPSAIIAIVIVFAVHPKAVASFTFNPNLAIPDNSTVGVADTRIIAGQNGLITSVTLSLQLTGTPASSNAFNGDFYAYLQHDSGFAVLLNRTGRTAVNGFGYGDSGFHVTFDDSAANGDIHQYRNVTNPGGGALTGIWQPDGRATNPNSVLATDTRVAMLDSFQGLDPNGAWTLFVADVSPIGTAALQGWTLNFEVAPIPEPGTIGFGVALLGASLLASARTSRRRRAPLN